MAESKGHQCPECGAPRGPDNTPSCACTERAAEALRDVRTAEAAAAEDFDPLRIRPYVELEGAAEVPPRAADPHVTMPLPAVPPTPPAPAPAGTEPSDADLSLFTGGPGAFEGTPDALDEEQPRRPRRPLMFGVAGVLVTVVTAAGLASGVFSYDTPTRDQAAPEEVRASVPDTTPTSESPSASTPSATPTSAAPSPTPTGNGSPSPTPTRPNTPAPTPTGAPDPTPTTAPTATPTNSAGAPENGREAEPPVLSRGDEGPEVLELELRLTQADVYTREAKGTYNEGVEDAVRQYQLWRGIVPKDYGVYDLETRERLESETQEP